MAVLSRLRVFAGPLRRRCAERITSRAYGSAAAVELDYYNEEEEYEWRRRDRKPTVDSEELITGRGIQWVVMGHPGTKKHVYAERLSKLLEVPLISMGSLVRQELNPRSSIYHQIANAVNEGKLVPEEITFGLLSKRLEEGYCKGETGFILDGIPRTRLQAEILDQIADIDLVINFKSTEELLLKKNLGTGYFSSPTNIMHSWKEKFQLYAEQNKPLEDYYRRQMKLVEFPVTGAPGEKTWEGLLAALHLQHINAVSSEQKLSAA